MEYRTKSLRPVDINRLTRYRILFPFSQVVPFKSGQKRTGPAVFEKESWAYTMPALIRESPEILNGKEVRQWER